MSENISISFLADSKIPEISKEELDRLNQECANDPYLNMSFEDSEAIKDQLTRMSCFD